MNSQERDIKIIEIHSDVRYIKEWIIEHKALHQRYSYLFITVIIGIIISLIK